MRIQRETGEIFTKTEMVYGQSKYIGIHPFASVMNSIAATGGTCLGIEAQIILPDYAYKSKFHAIEKNLKEICEQHNVELLEVKSFKNSIVKLPMVMITGVGEKVEKEEEKNFHTGQEIVLTKWVGMDGMLQIADERERELRRRFSPFFLKQIQSYKEELFSQKEIQIARKREVIAIHQITDGGVFAALWNLAKEAGAGLEIWMKELSVLQETIEVCEHFRLNPYQMVSTGSFLMITDDGNTLAEELRENEIKASVIGRLTDNHDKIIHNGEEVRYIDRPAPDEILKIFDV